MAQRLRWERVEGVARAFSRLSLGEVLAFEEQADPQYKLVSRLASEVGPGKAAVAALLTGLASYRLAMRGEEWWLCFYRHMRSSLPRAEGLEGVLRAVEGFLTSCSGAAIGREAKLRRVRKAASAAETLRGVLEDPPALVEMAPQILEALRTALGEKGFRKTTVFSVKIAYYAVRPLAGRRPLTLDVPIPVDVRVACASISSGMVDAPSYREVVARPEAAQRAWGYVSRSSGIPVLHIDSILWVTGWAPRELPPGEARDMVASLLSRALDREKALLLASELVRRPCPGG
ncbi:N-glycosylase/DNA lyase [Aeropyrum camini]|uniref:N-glycosylase/DNA lyase n=1 Tax=Aeropyrum camini SY1 = JCM 12091 TaxID=1198449 RepID=U3T8Z3_9CREN|nr:N-glycosylase/DNA lyase [Aeropyrum camini]BAN89992.1 N-glycosylase/DNA lyase [Aeropyrum camini SY1 = JCM 12091]